MTTDDGALPPDAHVGRVAHRVADLDRTAEFYRDVVGLPQRERSADRAVLGPESGPALLDLRAAPDVADRPDDAAGLFHVAFRVPDRGALADALARVRDRWRLSGASDHLVSEALYLSDPEGNGVEIYCDRPREEWPRTPDGGVDMDTLALEFDSLPDGRGDERVPAGTDVGHVHLEVTSLQDAEAFYRALGMGVQARYGTQATFLAAGDYHHHVGLNTWNGGRAPASGRGLAWFEVAVPDRDALDRAVDRLEEHGVTVDREGGDARTADPDDIALRLRVGRPARTIP